MWLVSLLHAAAMAASPGCVAIGQDSVTAGDLSAVAPAFAALPAATHVAHAPAPGITRWIAEGELARLGRALGLTVTPVGVCVERIVEAIDSAKVLAALRAAGPGFEIELLDFGPRLAPPGRMEFQVHGLPHLPRAMALPAAPPPAILWRGRLLTGNGRAFPIWARTRVSQSRPGVIAVKDLDAGQMVTSDDIAQVQLTDYPGWEAPLSDSGLALGRRVRRRIAAQAPVMSHLLAVRREIERGDSVTVDLGESQATLTAQAESPGRKGETVLLKNPLTGRRFASRVTGAGRAIIAPERASARPRQAPEEAADARP